MSYNISHIKNSLIKNDQVLNKNKCPIMFVHATKWQDCPWQKHKQKQMSYNVCSHNKWQECPWQKQKQKQMSYNVCSHNKWQECPWQKQKQKQMSYNVCSHNKMAGLSMTKT